jgi:hypothetical protein
MRSCWVLSVLLAALPCGAVRAETASATLQVSAQVLPHARLESFSALPVQVTLADVQRGYVDVSRQYRLRTNAPERVALQLNPRLGLTTAIDIGGLQAPLRMLDQGLEVSLPLAREFTLQYRLWLEAAAQPGAYELPLQVAAIVR